MDVDGLEAYTNYTFTVEAHNGVSEVAVTSQRATASIWVSVGHAGKSVRGRGGSVFPCPLRKRGLVGLRGFSILFLHTTSKGPCFLSVHKGFKISYM